MRHCLESIAACTHASSKERDKFEMQSINFGHIHHHAPLLAPLLLPLCDSQRMSMMQCIKCIRW